MNCPICENLLGPDGSCRYCSKTRPSLGKSGLKSGLIALVVAGVALTVGLKQLGYLSRQTGMQWDQEMKGDWVRSEQKLAQIYRIHIVDRQDQALGENHRSYRPGERLVANFHLRAARAGVLQPRLLLDGAAPAQSKEPKPLRFSQGGYQEFHSTLIPVTIPEQPGKHVLRLEVEDPESHQKAFWETDIQVRKP